MLRLCLVTFAILNYTTLFAQTKDDSTVDKVAAARNREKSASNLKQQMIAMHNYHSDYNRLPAHAMYDKTGTKPLLSWRVNLLPYLERDDLFKKFKLDEPWDSEHNKALLKEMPKVYQVPGVKGEEGKTHYQVFTMPAKVPAGKTDTYRPMFSVAPTKLTLGQLTVQDGTSNTVAIAEAGQPVEWTKPEDIVLQHDDAPFPKLGIRSGTDEFQVVLGDGSVRSVKKKIDDMEKHQRLLKQLIGRRDGKNEDVKDIMK